MKSPLKENINNFRCLKTLKEMIPKGSVVNSFHLFGGADELALAADQRLVFAHTTQYIIYEFWNCALEDPSKILAISKELFPKIRNKHLFNVLQEKWTTYRDPFLRAALFFMLNKCSDTGFVSCGQLDDKNFNPISLSHLKKFKADHFQPVWDEKLEFHRSFRDIKNNDYLLFPIGKFNYNLFEEGKSKGHEMTTIHHQRFYDTLQDVKDKWIVLYKYHPRVHLLYKNYNIIMLDKYGRETQDKEKCEEVVIANF
jgi:site-specific DNA-adenine methylase